MGQFAGLHRVRKQVGGFTLVELLVVVGIQLASLGLIAELFTYHRETTGSDIVAEVSIKVEVPVFESSRAALRPAPNT